jgi:hypothetical protein
VEQKFHRRLLLQGCWLPPVFKKMPENQKEKNTEKGVTASLSTLGKSRPGKNTTAVNLNDFDEDVIRKHLQFLKSLKSLLHPTWKHNTIGGGGGGLVVIQH